MRIYSLNFDKVSQNNVRSIRMIFIFVVTINIVLSSGKKLSNIPTYIKNGNEKDLMCPTCHKWFKNLIYL